MFAPKKAAGMHVSHEEEACTDSLSPCSTIQLSLSLAVTSGDLYLSGIWVCLSGAERLEVNLQFYCESTLKQILIVALKKKNAYVLFYMNGWFYF